MVSYIKHKTCRSKNPTAISSEHNNKRCYTSMNVLHCLEKLYAVILPFASQVNTRRDFAAILKSSARSRGRVSTNQTSETRPAGYEKLKEMLTFVTTVKKSMTETFTHAALRMSKSKNDFALPRWIRNHIFHQTTIFQLGIS